MNIEKISGAGKTASNPVFSNIPKSSEEDFNQVLKNAILKGEIKQVSSINKMSPLVSLDDARLQQIRGRIADGFYDRPDTLTEIADKLIAKGSDKW